MRHRLRIRRWLCRLGGLGLGCNSLRLGPTRSRRWRRCDFSLVLGLHRCLVRQRYEHDTHLAELDKSTRDALERAEAAGKLAEGKFVYSLVLSDDAVKFPVNRHELSKTAQDKLMEFAEKLKGENKNVYLEIQGHTDASGGKEYNYKLGEERAEAVRRYLSKQGIALNRMSTISYGEDEPVSKNTSRKGRAQNRRVVVVVLA